MMGLTGDEGFTMLYGCLAGALMVALGCCLSV